MRFSSFAFHSLTLILTAAFTQALEVLLYKSALQKAHK